MAVLRSILPRDVVITGVSRTPIGSFLGSLSSQSAHQLGAVAISGALKRSRLDPLEVQEVVIGQVLPAGEGQAPQRQAALLAGIPPSVDVYGVNKVCSSGLKAIILAAQSISLGGCDIAVAAGMESMSNCPYYLSKLRAGGYKHGHGTLIDGLLRDGLWDPYNDFHMGMCAEKTAAKLSISRAAQDQYAVESYRRATAAWKSGVLKKEVVCVQIHKEKRSPGTAAYTTVEEDEEYLKLNLDTVAGLKPAFDRTHGTITAANASKLSDGAAAVVLMSAERARELHLQPLARILSFADAAVEPVDFPVAPAQAVRNAIERAHMKQSSVEYHEINEAFSAVALANLNLLGLSDQQVNLHGGAVSLGHPLGMSGARIIISLLNVLESKGASIGCASICNGGGGATAMVIDRHLPSKL